VTLILSPVASQDRQAIAEKIQALPSVNRVGITRADDQAILDALRERFSPPALVIERSPSKQVLGDLNSIASIRLLGPGRVLRLQPPTRQLADEGRQPPAYSEYYTTADRLQPKA
jgi:hypothetical protein